MDWVCFFSLLQVKGETIHKVGRLILSNHAFFILYYLVGSDKILDFFLQKLSSDLIFVPWKNMFILPTSTSKLVAVT